MFADAALAARIDRAEARMCAHIAESMRAVTPGLSPLVLPISGGEGVHVSAASPIKKVNGLGLDGELDVAALERIEQEWHYRGEPVRIELSILADPSVGAALTGR